MSRAERFRSQKPSSETGPGQYDVAVSSFTPRQVVFRETMTSKGVGGGEGRKDAGPVRSRSAGPTTRSGRKGALETSRLAEPDHSHVRNRNLFFFV